MKTGYVESNFIVCPFCEVEQTDQSKYLKMQKLGKDQFDCEKCQKHFTVEAKMKLKFDVFLKQ